MADREQPRSIRFPQRLWDEIDRDAIRCGRSAVKQMEVLLSTYYRLRDVDLDYNRMSAMRGETAEPPSRTLAARTQSSSRPRINAEELNRRKAGDNPNKKKSKRVA